MRKIRAGVNWSQPILPERLEILPKDQKPIIIPKNDIISLDINKSATRYIDKCSCVFNDTNYNAFPLIEKDAEIKIFGIIALNHPVTNVFHGLPVKGKLDRDNKTNRRVGTFFAMSFPLLLTEKRLILYAKNYTEGYGEVIKDIVKPTKMFNVNDVLEEKTSGKVYFDKISILDALRYLAYVRRWCLYFEGKSIHFRPCKRRRVSGTINLSELEKFTIEKEL
jgi:hypothetical protein